jgi:hypothetical protein
MVNIEATDENDGEANEDAVAYENEGDGKR